MPVLVAILLLGSAVRVLVLARRPSADQRFHRRRRRRLLARRTEQLGDALVLVAAVTMALFGFGRSPGRFLLVTWGAALLIGFAGALFAHEVAHRYRPPPSPRAAGPSAATSRRS